MDWGYLFEIGLTGKLQCLLEPDNTYLLALRPDQAHFWHPDPLVDAEFVADGFSSNACWLCRTVLQRTRWSPRERRKASADAKA